MPEHLQPYADLQNICAEQLVLWRDIVMNSPGFIHPAEGCQLVLLRPGVEDMVNRNSSRDDCIGNQRAMTPPGNCFRAHDCSWFERCQREKIVERLLELSAFHVVGVGAEARIPPLRVVRITTPATASAK